MSWSLQVRHGDLTLSTSSLNTVTGKAKLVQDLRCYILERMGTDNLHPEYGSLLDGGITPEGQVVEGVIGETNIDIADLEIEVEIDRIVRNYQALQLARAKRDKLVLGRATLSAEEVLLALGDIQIDQAQDQIDVKISIQTAANERVSLDVVLAL